MPRGHTLKEFASTTSCSPTQVRADTLMRSEVQAGWRMARTFLTCVRREEAPHFNWQRAHRL